MRIHHLHLLEFRNHADTSIQTDGQSVVLVGHNGAGKTNILEAISLLSPGRGFRQAKLKELTRNSGDDSGWVVAAQLASAEASLQIGTALDVESGIDKRLVKIDGERLKSQAEMCDYVSVVWQTPQMDGLFLESGSMRRRYLDRIVYQFDSAHATRVTQYEHAMRERSRLLKHGNRDDQWLGVLERQMAELTCAIAGARLQAVQWMHQALQASSSAFPIATLTLSGEAELALQEGMAASDYEQQFSELLASRRFIDTQAGRATRGAHRTQLLVWFNGGKMEAANGSTGEQKALLLTMMLAQARARVMRHQSPPILLLDEVVAHLDHTRRRDLFLEIESLGAQAFMTGTDAADFSAAPQGTQHLSVLSGRVF